MGDAAFRGGIPLWDESEEEWYLNPPPPDVTQSGDDVFVFMPSNGNDTIHDFEQGSDLIELWGFAEQVKTFKGSDSAWDRLPDRAKENFLEEQPLSFERLVIDVVDGDSVINTGEGHSITVRNVDTLNADNFAFFREAVSADYFL